jgi:ABC-type branched-subunit amino acid transport system substrate-binding protein
MFAPVSSALRRLFVATWPLAVLIALASCAPPQVKEAGPQAQAPAPVATPSAPARVPVAVPPPSVVGPVVSPANPVGPEVVLTAPPGVKPRVTVGLLLPLSGPQAALGHALLDAASLAVFEVADASFILVPRDTKGTPDGARAAATAALEAGAKLLLGPVFAPDVSAVAPLARAANVSVIAFSNDRTVAGSGTYLLGLPPIQPISRVVAYAVSRGLTRFAALVPDNSFGQRVSQDMSAAAARAGGVVPRVESYQPGQQAMTRAVQKLGSYDERHAAMERQRAALKAASDEASRQALRRLEGAETVGGVGFDAVLLPETGRALETLAPLLPYYDIDTRHIRVLGIGDWRDRAVIREPSLTGAWVAGPSPEARAAFERRFAAAFGQPPHPLAPLAYDATALAAVLASGQKGPDFGQAALTARNGFAGSTGIFRLDADGTVERGLAVMEVHPDGLRVISPAPDAFPDAGS